MSNFSRLVSHAKLTIEYAEKLERENQKLQARVNDMERMDYPCQKCEVLEAQLDALIRFQDSVSH